MKNMKRFLNIVAVAVLAVAALSSCKQENPDKKAQFDYATVTAKYFVNDDLAKAADLTLNIIKFDGTKMSLPVSTTQQVVDIEKYRGTIPAEFNFSFSAKLNDNLTKESYDCKLTYEITVKAFDTNGKVKSKVSKDEVGIGEKKANMDLVVARFNRIDTKMTIGEDMSVTESAN